MSKKIKQKKEKVLVDQNEKSKSIKAAKISPFDEFFELQTSEDKQLLLAFFKEIKRHTLLSRKENLLMRRDFENAIVYYAQNKVPLADMLARLDPINLGGFYARPPALWYPLDDAAKIYPLSIKHGQMDVFRLSMYLVEPVVPVVLQIALSFVIKRFPSFATTVKKGFFWHYLDASKKRYQVEIETNVPCQPLSISQSGSQSFRVLYYGNRISIEFFHVLTDGTGGMLLLKTLVLEYLRLLGVKTSEEQPIFNINDAPHIQETANEFNKSNLPKKKSGFMGKSALQMSGKIAAIKPCRIIHYKLDTEQLKQVACEKQASITAYITALIMVATKYATEANKGSINIHVPVNMRKYYPSLTIRNFSMYCGIRMRIDTISDVDTIIPEIKQQLATKTGQEPMTQMMTSVAVMVKSLRFVPLFIKTPIASLIYGLLSDNLFSNTLSNLGIVSLPKEMEPYVESMDFILGPGITNRAKCTLVTYQNTTTLSVSKLTIDPSFEEKLYELLKKDGLTIELEGSDTYES